MKRQKTESEKWENCRWLVSLIVTGGLLAAGCFLCLTHRAEAISISERRKLAQFPEVSWEKLENGKWMDEFEDYSLDQFPFRETFRSIKAYVQQTIFRQKDNNGVYVVDGNVSRLVYPLSEDSILRAADKFNSLCETYMKGTDVKLYYSIVPDKNYFLAEAAGYPSMDYDRLVELMAERIDGMAYIDLFPCLEIGDYYRTDTHWSQDKILDVAETIAEAMGVEDRLSGEYELKELSPFYGVYYGQSALALEPDTIRYLTNEEIENCVTFNEENQQTRPVYDVEKFSNMDPYDLFLSGATPLITIENPAGEKGKELVIFRDSFGSSLAPLLIEAYEKITLVDIRYIRSELLGRYLEFTDQDVLFLYSTLVLNGSNILR